MTKVELLQILGNNLRKYRLENGLTQEELAEKTGISTSFCANLERGKKGMSITFLRELADSLNVSVDFLLYEEVPTIRTRNIEALLRNKPEQFIISRKS